MLSRASAPRLGKICQQYRSSILRSISTLPNDKYIYAHDGTQPGTYVLSYLEDSPPNPNLALGTATALPPTPDSFKQNDDFLKIVQWVIKDHAIEDPAVQQQAAVFASQAGVELGSGGLFFQNSGRNRRRASTDGGRGSGGASSQGGMGSGGRGGYIHVSDQRNPPDYGRIAWPEDIFGSLELDGHGKFVDPKGRYQESGTYRLCTTEGLLGLSPFLRDKVRERVKELAAQAKANA